jgi:hypothetical protein
MIFPDRGGRPHLPGIAGSGTSAGGQHSNPNHLGIGRRPQTLKGGILNGNHGNAVHQIDSPFRCLLGDRRDVTGIDSRDNKGRSAPAHAVGCPPKRRGMVFWTVFSLRDPRCPPG